MFTRQLTKSIKSLFTHVASNITLKVFIVYKARISVPMGTNLTSILQAYFVRRNTIGKLG